MDLKNLQPKKLTIKIEILTKVDDENLLKVLTWYDNEWGFTNQMIREILAIKR
jgi:glyceraldehyde-3-phosphate dehydrogenase/erythrose-4-phosphate dehydrogenase